MYYTYMLRCKDNSIYTGITSNLERRMEEHFSQNEKCAKYTASHQAQKLEAVWESENRVFASKLEFHIKKSLTKKEKEELIKDYNLLDKFLGNKIEATNYKRVNIKIS